MKPFVLFLAMTLQATTIPSGPATVANAKYPLRVHLFVAHGSGKPARGYQGFGRGDVLGDVPKGFDFSYDCNMPILNNAQLDESYQARWLQPDREMELLVQAAGSERTDHCTLKMSMKPAPYGKYKSSTK